MKKAGGAGDWWSEEEKDSTYTNAHRQTRKGIKKGGQAERPPQFFFCVP
jgi:hypothetical protein